MWTLHPHIKLGHSANAASWHLNLPKLKKKKKKEAMSHLIRSDYWSRSSGRQGMGRMLAASRITLCGADTCLNMTKILYTRRTELLTHWCRIPSIQCKMTGWFFVATSYFVRGRPYCCHFIIHFQYKGYKWGREGLKISGRKYAWRETSMVTFICMYFYQFKFAIF